MQDVEALIRNDRDVDLWKQMTRPAFVLLGVWLAVGIGFGHWLLPEAYVIQSLGVLCGVLGGAYMGMGVLARDAKRQFAQIGMGLAVMGLAFAGLWVSPLFFAAACFAHAGWDVVSRHPKGLNLPLVDWYVPTCLGYDLLFGILIVAWWTTTR